MLEERVSAIEVTMENALGTLTSILADMSAIKQFYTKEAGAHTNDVGSDIPMAGDHDGTCTPPEPLHCERKKDVGDGVPLASSPSNLHKHTTPHQGEGPHAASLVPPSTMQDDVSSHSGRNNRGGAIGSLPRSPLAKIAHANPHMRVLPFESRLAVTRPPACKERAPVTGSASGATAATRYRDPPGYSDTSDMGCTSDSESIVPVLAPRKSSVSSYVSQPQYPHIVLHKYRSVSCSGP